MERKATNLEEAKALFGESAEPVTCTKEGSDPITATDEAEAAAYFGE